MKKLVIDLSDISDEKKAELEHFLAENDYLFEEHGECFSTEIDNWMDAIAPLINEFKDGDDSPLDGDEVDRLCEIIKAKINFNEGNLTDEEYEKILK